MSWPIAKTIAQRLATKESTSDLNNNFCDWTKREELFYKRNVLYIPVIKIL